MPSVLMLCKGYPPTAGGGGVETYSEEVARAYRKRGLQVVVITQTEGRRGWQDREYPEGRIPIFNTGPGGQLVTALKMLRAVSHATRQHSFDFHHATTWRPAMPLVAAHRRAPIVITAHGREVSSAPAPLRPLMRAVFRHAIVVVAVSSATLLRARSTLGLSVGTARWIVVANGLSYPPNSAAGCRSSIATRSTTAPVRLLTLARLVERKNVQGCITALRALKESGISNFEYRIAGTGPLAASLQEQVQNADLADQVRLLGYVEAEEVPNLYRWADVFLHPQIDVGDGKDFEGFGLSIADAMAFGCLVIAGKGSGPTDFIKDGVTGILVDGSNQNELQDTIRPILANAIAYEAIALNGQEYVHTELSWDKHVNAVISALRMRRTSDNSRT